MEQSVKSETYALQTTLMARTRACCNSDISVNNEKLQTVHCFKFQGAVISDEGSKLEVLSRMA